MKTVISALLVLAVIVLFAQIVLSLGSYTGARAAKKSGNPVIGEAVSSSPTMEGIGAVWSGNRGNHFSPFRK